MQDEQVLAAIGASMPRRVIAVVLLSVSGGTLVYHAISSPTGPVWQVLLIALGVTMLWTASRMWQATGGQIELTATELRDSDGTRIAFLTEIEALDRGTLSARPSNGFVIRLRTQRPVAWRPGMWWRLGRRVGIGGVTPGPSARAMADMLASVLAGHK